MSSCATPSKEPSGEQHSTGAVVALVVMLLLATRTLQGWLGRIAAPVTWDYGPAQLAVRVDMLVHGIPLYRDFRIAPFIPLVYGPIVPWITAPLAAAFGKGPMAALEAGRILTIASTLGVCAMIFLLARKVGASVTAVSLATLGFVLSPIVLRWGFEYRVDMPALACELGGIIAFASGLSAPALALFVISFFIKQDHAIGIVAISLLCWISGERTRALKLGLLWLALVAAITLTLAAIYPWYWLNAFASVRVTGFDLSAPILFLAVLVGGNLGLAIFATLALTRRRVTDHLILCLLAVALIHDLLSCLRWGSNAYYFLPTLAVLAIIAASGIDLVLKRIRRMRAVAQVAAGVSLALLLSLGYLTAPRAIAMSIREVFSPSLRCHLGIGSIWDAHTLARLRAIDGPIVTDMAELNLVDDRSNLQWIDLMVLTSMRQLGTFDDAALIEVIRRHKIAAVALDGAGLDRNFRGRALFWPALRRAIEENYTLDPGAGPPFLMLPNASADSRGRASAVKR